jgi:glycosyltransferase involved in cell wall biosynthesis
MKIVYCAPFGSNFPSRDANSIHIMRMCEAFANLGHEVILLVSHKGKGPEEIFVNYGIAANFRIMTIKIPLVKGKTLYYSLKAGMVARSLNPDIVAGRNTIACAFTAGAGIPTVYDSHYPVWENHFIDRASFRIMKNSRSLVRMTTNSHALKRMYEEKGLTPGCGITVAHNGSSPFSLSEVPEKWPGRPDCLQVGYTGHLYQGRGMEIIAECARLLPGIDFHVVGGTDNDIDRWRRNSEAENLIFHGFIRHSEIHRYRNKCDVLLAPYMDTGIEMAGGGGDQSKYMNPIKIIEYMSARKAIICSDLPILKELLDEESAVFVSPAEISLWVKAIENMTDVRYRTSLAENAFRKYKNRLTWEARAGIFLNDIRLP